MLKYQIAVFLIFFMLFTTIIASGLFGSKLNIELREPSPTLITAPYDKEIEDLTKYHEDQNEAAKAVKPVYTSDAEKVSSISTELNNIFLTLKLQLGSRKDISQKIDELRLNSVLDALPDSTLHSLLTHSENDLFKAQEIITRIIIGIATDPENGAKAEAEVPLLKDKMKEEVQKSSLSEAEKTMAQALIELKVTEPTLIIDEIETRKLQEAASAGVKPTVHQYRANEKIVGPGEIVDERIYQVLVNYGLVEVQSPWIPVAGIAIHVLIGMVILVLFAYQFSPEIFIRWKSLVLIALAILLVLIIGKGFLAIDLGQSDLNNLTTALIPVAWATMTVTILLGVKIAVVVAIILGIFVGTMADPASLGVTGSIAGLFALVGGIVGIQSVARLDQRSDLARAGLYIALVNVALISGIALIIQMSPTYWFIGCILGLFNGFLSSALTMGTLPWFESGFHITSSVRLLELSNPNSRLLKSLLMEAPGTYHHSVLVGNLAETAAEDVGADAVLVRVGALYHDIGKLKRPYFFIENQFSKDNPHDKIAPTLSALILISHVKDGLEMAREHKLPDSIKDIIAQHHGDSLTSFFYHKAKEENPDITDESFRYDGLRPQSKEAALVLLADNVEAAVRSHKGNTPGRIEGLVRKIIKDKFDEGLLDQCDLTFKDLDKISTAFVKVLSGIFHSRVEYPELPSAKKTLEEKNQVREEENDVIDELEVAEIEQETMSEEVNDLQAAEDSQEATDADQESSDVGGSDNKGT
ncbi:MAG: hypothetical protein APF84_08000 [Gracilibacter sp. BRH_c7a]|nr:MAG: hypothetical protein APF84_08000 [Gracilibacter sp. BRH_c7a]